MGYVLNALGDMPVDDTVKKYIYIVKEDYNDELSLKVTENFFRIARNIGSEAVISAGLEEKKWLNDVGRTYLGDDWPLYEDLAPALIISDAHPDQAARASETIVIPLAKVPEFYPNWSRFFALLAEYAQGKNQEIVKRLQPKADVFDAVNRVLSIKPGFLGISINFNELAASFVKDRRKESQPPLVRD
jgi:hypothetical protein